MSDVKRFADRVTVMRGGRTIQTFDPQTVSVPELVRLTVGESAPASSTSRRYRARCGCRCVTSGRLARAARACSTA